MNATAENKCASSILSFPERGPWGNAAWRGNCSGHIYAHLFRQLRPAFFCDPMMGSGTSIDVARSMGIRAVGLDLHQGYNILRDDLRDRLGEAADLVLSHPPYFTSIVYSGEQWGTPHADDLSRSVSVDDFQEKLHIAVLNQRNATRAGGHYGVVIGDVRKDGKYHSFQADIIARMPQGELAAVLIKAQHATRSASRVYQLRYPRIMHEFIVLWRRSGRLMSWLGALENMARTQHKRLRSAWRAVVRSALVELGGQAALPDLYRVIERNARSNLETNATWRATVRRVCQEDPAIEQVDRGVWRLAQTVGVQA
jgi:hypothetical protein